MRMFSDPATTIQLATLLAVGIAVVSAALFLAWRDARQSAFQRRRKRRRASIFKIARPP